jgi:hypothetical protein
MSGEQPRGRGGEELSKLTHGRIGLLGQEQPGQLPMSSDDEDGRGVVDEVAGDLGPMLYLFQTLLSCGSEPVRKSHAWS